MKTGVKCCKEFLRQQALYLRTFKKGNIPKYCCTLPWQSDIGNFNVAKKVCNPCDNINKLAKFLL